MKKKNILVIPYSYQIGSTMPLVVVAEILRKIGHNVIFAGEGTYIDLARKKNFIVERVSEIPIEKYRESTDKGNLDYLSEEEINNYVQEEIELCKKYKIDLIFDTLRPTTYITAKLLGIKKVGLIYSVLTKYYGLRLPVPESHFLYSTRFFPPLFKFLGTQVGRLRNFFYVKYAAKYKKYLKSKGITSNADYEDLETGDLALVYDAKEFAPLSDKAPKKYHYVGPLLLSDIGEIPWWLEDVKRKKEETGYPVVYLSMGSSGKFYPSVLKSLYEYSKIIKPLIIISNSCLHGTNGDTENYIPENNVYLIDYASADELMKLSDLVILHGGRGTLYHALSYGKPMIGIPHQPEQEWNISRLEDLKLGLKVSKKFYNSSLLNTSLNNIFANYDQFEDNLKTYRKIVNSYDTEILVKAAFSEIININD